MTMRTYIVEFHEPGEVADAYQFYIVHRGFLLNTEDALKLSERVKVRFDFLDGSGITLICKVVSELKGQGYGVQLPGGEELDWLLAKSKTYADQVKRTRRRLAQEAQDAPPGETAAPAADSAARPESRPPPRSSAEGIEDTKTRPLQHSEIKSVGPSLSRSEAKTGAHPTSPVDGAPRRPTSEMRPAGPSTKDGIRTGKSEPAPEADDELQRIREMAREQKILSLPPNQKKKLAISGVKAERLVLAKDPDRALHIWLLKNPEIEEDEVEVLSRLETLSSEALNFLFGNRRWGTVAAIALNLALNPQTPPEAIPNLLTVLPTEKLKQLVNMPGIRHLVSRQARRILMERSEL
jgi:hypothetical protein